MHLGFLLSELSLLSTVQLYSKRYWAFIDFFFFRRIHVSYLWLWLRILKMYKFLLVFKVGWLFLFPAKEIVVVTGDCWGRKKREFEREIEYPAGYYLYYLLPLAFAVCLLFFLSLSSIALLLQPSRKIQLKTLKVSSIQGEKKKHNRFYQSTLSLLP